MKVLIIYFSKTGNTKKLAYKIAEGIEKVPDVEYIIKSTEKVTKNDFLDSDGIIAGSPVYFGSMASELKNVFDKYVGIREKMENKVGAAFSTSADQSGGKETTIISIIEAMLIYGMIIVGDPIDASGHYGISCIGSPDEKTSLNAAKLGERVANLVKKIKSF